ncbi:MAG TPA: hypothetical protein DDW41_00830 [Candidatus Andersenbacteria bacterium]|nr:hypothetical protein [Candidatus Andersenbacteria bacterium]
MDIAERRWLAKNPVSPWDGIGIIVAASHPGAINTTAPIVDYLVNKHKTEVALYTSGKINDNMVPNFQFSRQPDSITKYNNVVLPKATDQATLALISTSSPPDIDRCELPLASQIAHRLDDGKKALVVLAEDNIGGLRSVIPQLNQHGISSDRINRMLLAAGSAIRTYPEDDFGVPRERMRVTGSATFDGIKIEDTAAVNKEVREQLEIPFDTLVIGYFGMPSQEPHFENMEFRSTKLVSKTIDALARNHPNRQFTFLYRRHPRENKPNELRQLLPENRSNLRVIPHEESQKIPTTKISATTDLGVALGSTVLTEMALRGSKGQTLSATGSIPLYLLNADGISVFGYPDHKYEIPIPVQLGAAAVAWNDEQLLSIMENALFDSSSRRQIAKRQATALKTEYAFDITKSAAELAVSEIEQLLLVSQFSP